MRRSILPLIWTRAHVRLMSSSSSPSLSSSQLPPPTRNWVWRNQPDSETKQNEKRGEMIGERSPKTRDLSRTASINWSVRFLKLFSFEYKWIAHVIPFYICKNAVLQPTHDQVRPRERQPWWRGDTVHLPPWKNTQINCLEHFQGKVLPYRLLRYSPFSLKYFLTND